MTVRNLTATRFRDKDGNHGNENHKGAAASSGPNVPFHSLDAGVGLGGRSIGAAARCAVVRRRRIRRRNNKPNGREMRNCTRNRTVGHSQLLVRTHPALGLGVEICKAKVRNTLAGREIGSRNRECDRLLERHLNDLRDSRLKRRREERLICNLGPVGRPLRLIDARVRKRIHSDRRCHPSARRRHSNLDRQPALWNLDRHHRLIRIVLARKRNACTSSHINRLRHSARAPPQRALGALIPRLALAIEALDLVGIRAFALARCSILDTLASRAADLHHCAAIERRAGRAARAIGTSVRRIRRTCGRNARVRNNNHGPAGRRCRTGGQCRGRRSRSCRRRAHLGAAVGLVCARAIHAAHGARELALGHRGAELDARSTGRVPAGEQRAAVESRIGGLIGLGRKTFAWGIDALGQTRIRGLWRTRRSEIWVRVCEPDRKIEEQIGCTCCRCGICQQIGDRDDHALGRRNHGRGAQDQCV
eukprot:comp22491_c0_seq1/m.55895 comp22491_c0_seq1/g.55895  ORF comp22491_c0_seq1/g.55895 comp22491_c0_seq1/m.55895 type:complete len:477 (+) comp22491_c0_seq1:51-1481(+)